MPATWQHHRPVFVTEMHLERQTIAQISWCMRLTILMYGQARPMILRASGHLSVKDQRRQDRIVPALDDDLPFVLNVESAFWITGRGTVIMGVIEQGVLHIGDHLEVIQPSSAGTAPPRFECLGIDPAPRVTGRDYAALGYPIVIFIGPDIKPDAIRPGAKLQVARPLAGH
jgi:hypothetical protein